MGMTIDRNVTSSRMNAIERTNRNTIGRCDFIVSRKSLDDAVTPDTVTSAPGSLPTLAGDPLARRTARGGVAGGAAGRQGVGRGGVGALALHGDAPPRDGLRGVDLDVERLGELTAGDRLVVQLCDGGLDLGRGDVLGLDDDARRHAAAGERGVDAVERPDDRLAAGHALGAGLLELHAE